MRQKKLTFFAFMLLSCSMIFSQGQSFVRSATINPPTTFGSGFGSTVAGVDLDNDGKLEIYSLNGMSDYNNGDEYPQIIKYENNGGQWDSVWAASFPDERQNTWGALTTGDLDGDGKMEIIWGYTNSFGTNTTPPRIVVFENSGDDILGVPSAVPGNFIPNTSWDMDVPASTNMRPLKWEAYDIDQDGKQEIIFAERKDYYNFGIISVSDVPDAGTSGETWTMEFNSKTELYNQFVRSAVIDPSAIGDPIIGDPFLGGVGDVLSGVDIDKDGLMDAFLINDNTNDTDNGELIPTMTKVELVDGAWVPRWTIDLSSIVPKQNTWPLIKHGDLDGDGKEEIIWLPINNLGGDSLPARIVVFEDRGDTSDAIGIDDGQGGYLPNATWDMGVPKNTEMRPLNALVMDFDNDSKQEVLFAERKDYYGWGILSVSDIPDNGDGSETWTMEANGTGNGTGGSTYADMAVANGKMYVLPWDGKLTEISVTGGVYSSKELQTGVPFWSFKSMQGVDIDKDGTEEIIAANYSTGGQIYLLTPDVDTLAINQIGDMSTIGITRMPGGNVGDIDADGNLDFVVGARGTDKIGRLEYKGGTITDPASYNISLLDEGAAGTPDIGNFEVIHLVNIDSDASDEVLYTSAYQRSLDVGKTYPLVIGHYSDTLTAKAGRRWDMVIANGKAHFFDGSGNIQSVGYENGSYTVSEVQGGSNGAFLTASAFDMDNDGTEEIFIANWYDAKVTLLTWKFGYWSRSEIFDFSSMGGNRLNGGSVGDLDNDGFVDFVFGSRESTPNAQIYRVEYAGGDWEDPGSWRGEVIDQELNTTHTQYEVVKMANLDDDPELEVLYTSDYARGPNSGTDPQVPLVILNVNTVQTTPIADVKVDSDGNYEPDNIGQTFTIKGVVTTPDFNLSSTSSMSFYVQDETAGINVYAKPKMVNGLKVGDLVQLTGDVDQYKGLTELKITDSTNIVKLGLGTMPNPMVLSLDQFFMDPEKYEGSLIEIKGLAKSNGTWPDAGSDANLDMTDGSSEITMRVDKDVDIAGQTEPTYPIGVVGIVSQYDFNTPPNSGYQVIPRSYTDISQNVAVPPNPNFALLTPEDGAMVSISDSSDSWESTWNAAVDLNGDQVLYQWLAIDGSLASNGGTDTFYTIMANDILSLMNGADTLKMSWSVNAKGAEQDFVTSTDTFMVTFINDIQVGIENEVLPTKFYVAQNYPNPFNPTTTIRFGLVKESNVDLRVYDILGQEVAVLINNQLMSSAHHEVNFNASSLASGTYIYRLQANNKVITKKMLLLK